MATFNAKTPLDLVESAGFGSRSCEIKPGDTYFRAGRHYHRPGELNSCVRDGNRCFLSGMVARRGSWPVTGTAGGGLCYQSASRISSPLGVQADQKVF